MTLAFPNHVLDVTPLDQTNMLDFDKVSSTLGTLGTSAAVYYSNVVPYYIQVLYFTLIFLKIARLNTGNFEKN